MSRTAPIPATMLNTADAPTTSCFLPQRMGTAPFTTGVVDGAEGAGEEFVAGVVAIGFGASVLGAAGAGAAGLGADGAGVVATGFGASGLGAAGTGAAVAGLGASGTGAVAPAGLGGESMRGASAATGAGGGAGTGLEGGSGADRGNAGFGRSTAMGSVIRDLVLNTGTEPQTSRSSGAILVATRNFALRARGLRAVSVSPASTGFLFTGRHTVPVRSACFTRRSSSE